MCYARVCRWSRKQREGKTTKDCGRVNLANSCTTPECMQCSAKSPKWRVKQIQNSHEQVHRQFYFILFYFFAKADLVRDLRPLALPCCSNDYGGQNQAERESVYAKVKFEDSNLYKTLLVNRNLCTCIVLQRSNWQVTNYWIPCLAHHAQTFHIEFVHTE